ncbi:(2,3-dihydroxybenzoyl)adenylate synthase [Archaeoglobales archaeon]|nr:MAG: (2,3-dihydroxybenzoyl)adenylate synthase [Archaeoglobales archaeon]
MILHSEELIREYTEKGYWGNTTLLDIFYENAATHPDREAVVDPPNRGELVGGKPERISYSKFLKAVNSVAAELQDIGVGKDNIVLVQLPNVWELAMLYFAIAKAGGIISPMPMQWRQRELSYIAKLTGSNHYITVEEFKGFRHTDVGKEFVENVILLEDVRDFSKAGREPEDIEIDANEIFTICWTSGTEADPKGCPLSHNNWLWAAKNLTRVFGVQEGDRQLCVAPLVNMTAIGVNYISWLYTAGTLVLHHPFNPEICLKQLVEENINFTILVPAVLAMILKYPGIDNYDLSKARTITTGSAPPAEWVMREFKKRWGIEIINIWGQNEGTALIAGPDDVPDLAKRVDHFPWWGKEGCDWRSGVKGVETKIVDFDGKELTKPGSVGELLYRSPFTISCYFNRPDLTERAFVEIDGKRFFRTGDLFIIKDECYIGFYDRKKDIIIRGGFNISSAEIENILLEHPKVLEVAAVGMPDEVLGERVCVFIAPKGETPTLEELREFMKEKGVAVYKLPERLEIVDRIPRNPVDKILKSELKRLVERLKGKN